MRKITSKIPVLFLLLIAYGCKKQSNGLATDPTWLYTVSGKEIVDAQGNPLKIAGVAFGNEVWSYNEQPYTHHGEIDYKRIKDMGMNTVRFYLNYITLENDNAPYVYKQSGWRWIDDNIAWAKANGVYLILNVHVPQGGFQSLGNGDELWNNIENQNRLVAMWQAIAKRYASEPQIVGYGLLNEPVPNRDISQWQQLAQRAGSAIREVDENHILFIERAIYVKNKPETSDLNFPLVNLTNVAYEFHFYDPLPYTHQLFSWANMGDGGKYPDEEAVFAADTRWYTATFNSPSLQVATPGWQYIEGEKYKVTDANIKLGLPALVGQGVGGKVYFDDVVIKEFDAAGNFTRNIVSLSFADSTGWGFWSSNNTGLWGWAAAAGVANTAAVYIAGATADCNISNYNQLFVVRQGFSYQACGWMRGEQALASAACKIRVDFLSTNGPVVLRNKAGLDYLLKKYADWGNQKNVPIYLGEFGAGIHCFENGKGGLLWVNDMIDLAAQYKLYFTYHTYHEDNFGLYFGYGSLPNPAHVNQPLIDLFKLKLR
jgi:endoglucanase